MQQLKDRWKFSKLRFYYKNFIWNYKFFLFAKKKFKDITYIKGNDIFKPETVNKKRFLGYEFDSKIYLDNPGYIETDKEIWQHWKTKGYF